MLVICRLRLGSLYEREFNHRIRWVHIDIAEDADHDISAEERFRVAMAKQ